MKSATENRKPYSGLTRSLVIAIDVGTTFSGVSYAILEPGEIPKIHGVTRFPGQEHVAGNSKIPSVIYYDRHGKMMAAGAEADTSSVLAQAEDDGWTKAELFKLRLRPRTMQLNMNGMRLGPLPRRKTAVHVFGDFLAYLYRCTRNFITDTHGNGAALWNAVENNIQFVLSHPNGWEGAQQTKMRRSAVYGGLIPDTNEGKARIRFVTEGEASLHACVLNGLAADVLSNPSKHGFLIADAGGGTLDISAYAIRGTTPLVMEEIAPPDCIFAGSVFVSRRAREFLEEKLKNSKYGTPAALDHITQRFDETTKRLFRDRKDLQFIPFGSPLDKDLAVGIRGGQLKLTGNEVANLFEPSVDAAVHAIKSQIEASHGSIRSVFLVGGYAASPWLFNQLQERLAPLSITVSRPDTQTSKAVADGAIGFYCDHHVSARMSKFMYGVEFLRELDPTNPEHVARKERLCELPSGPKLLPDAFDCILNRSVKVKESTVFTRKYCTELTSLSMLSVFEVEIWCYRGGNVVPKWIDRRADDFSTLCVVRADLSPLSGSAEPKAGKGGKTYWTIVFSVEIHFGLTEFKARIKWIDDGKTKYGPASIIYNESGHRADEEEPDAYPEDDIGSSSPRNDRLRSEPASRARTPIEQFYHPSSGENRGFDYSPPKVEPPVEIPQVHNERTPSSSRGFALPASTFPASTFPPEPPRDILRNYEPEKEVEKEVLPDKKKGKGKDKTPKSTPKIEETLPPPVEPMASGKTPKDTFSSSLWATDPISTPAETKSSGLGWGASTPSSKEKAKEKERMKEKERERETERQREEKEREKERERERQREEKEREEKEREETDRKETERMETERKETERKETERTETERKEKEREEKEREEKEREKEKDREREIAEKAAIDAITAKASPGFGGILSSAKASPATTKKGKKKGASNTTTPAVEPIQPPADLVLAPETPSNNFGWPNDNKDAPPAATTEKPLSSLLTPVGLPEVTLSTKTPEPGTLTMSEDITSSLFSSSGWGNNDAAATDSLDDWGGFGKKVKTPKSRPKTPLGEASKVDERPAEVLADVPAAKTPASGSPSGAASKTLEDKPAAEALTAAPVTTPATPGTGWGSTVKTPGWGSAATTPASTTTGWGKSTTPVATTPSWGSSFGAKTTETKTPAAKTPWGSKATTPVTKATEVKTPSTPWGKKPLASTEPKDEVKEESVAVAALTDNAAAGEASATDSSLLDKVTTPKLSVADGSGLGETSAGTADADSSLPPVADTSKVPTPQPSPKPEEKALDPVTETETPIDVVSPTADGEDKEDKDDDEKKETGNAGGKKGGAGGGGAASKKKKKKK